MTPKKALLLGVAVALIAAGCAPATGASGVGKLKVVATTTIVGDVVKAIGRDAIEVSVLLPIGADPHSFEATPQDVAKIAEADVVFVVGTGLEEFMDALIENAGGEADVVSVSEHLPLLESTGAHEDEHAGEETEHADEGGFDPHVWFDPTNVMTWVDNIEQKLSAVDADNADAYAANAAAYKSQLGELHTWIGEQVAQIPEENRELVTDHAIFTYFAHRYGFEQIGAVIPGYSTAAEPSAQELAQLEDAIRELGVKAVFVGNTVSATLAQRVASDTGTQLVFLYTDSLGEPGSPASTYLDLMRYNVSAIVNALK